MKNKRSSKKQPVKVSVVLDISQQLKEMEAGLSELGPEQRALVEPKVKEWREICDAYFSDINHNAVEYSEEDAPQHIKRMKAILNTMEDEND